MKRTTFFLALACASLTTYGQKTEAVGKSSHLYVRVGATYAFPHAGSVQLGHNYLSGKSTYSYAGSTSTDNVDLKKGSLGAGLAAVVNFGYLINSNIGLELGASIGLAPKKYEFESSSTSTSGSGTTTSTFKSNIYQKMPILITPSIVIQTGQAVNIYSRVGLALPVAGKQIWEYEEHYTDPAGVTNRETEVEVKNRFAVGMQGALGAQFGLGGKLKLYVEINGVSLNAYAKHGTVTKSTENGTDQLQFMTVSEKEADFEFDATSTYPSTTPNSPQEASTFSSPYSNIGIGAGVVIQL
jgi:hypothetical protein